MDARSLAVAKLQMARHEIGVKVRQEHVADPAALPRGVLDVPPHVALRVDHGSPAARLIGD